MNQDNERELTEWIIGYDDVKNDLESQEFRTLATNQRQAFQSLYDEVGTHLIIRGIYVIELERKPQDILELSDTGKVINFEYALQVLSQLTDTIYKTAIDNGHYAINPEIAPLLMHIVHETTEASEAMLTNRFVHEPVMDMLSDRFHIRTFEDTVKNTAGDELADIIILALSIAKYRNVPIEKHLVMKMLYNAYRTNHSINTLAYSDGRK